MRLSAALRSLPPWLVLIVSLIAASLALSEQVRAQPPHPLNDTGIDWCADGERNNLGCPVSGYPGQDGEHGRDLTHHDDRDGYAGLSFTKLDAAGQDLPADATAWSCVRDNVTGALWEVKTDDGGLRDKDWTYSWYDPDSPDAEPGTENGGRCATAGRCDTEKYVEDVNAQGLCGFTDWRMPTIKELAGITHLGRTDPSIDTDYFPNRLSSWFWSASPSAYGSDDAWVVLFGNGSDSYYYKQAGGRVRLVRAEPWSLSFVDNGDGTISDANTGLMWAQCSAGQSGADCGTGSADRMTWQAALSYAENATFAGYDDWRLPNRRELRSLVDYSTDGLAIDEAFFPATPSRWFWSASPSARYAYYAWYVNFASGNDGADNKGNAYPVRLVRAGPWFSLLSLNIAISGNGSGIVTSDPSGIDCGSSCSASYAPGTEITLTATPAAGSELTGWSQTSCGTATHCTLRLDSAQTVTVTFATVGSGPGATHAAPETYVPGSLVTVTNHFSDAGSDRVSLVWRPQLPLGWTIEAVDGDGIPQVDGVNEIVFSGELNPPLELNFRYHVRVPSGDRDSKAITAVVKYRHAQPIDQELIPEPGTLWLRQQQIRRHHADYLEPYWTINATEFNRLLAYWRHGGYHHDPSSPDGYAEGAGATDGQRHDADYQDPAWRIDSFEVNRLAAYWRARDYHTEPAGFDGYAPGESARISSERLGADARVPPATDRAPQTSHSASLSHYRPGGSLRIDNRIGQTGDAPPLSLLWRPRLPPGWTIVSVQGDRGPVLSPDGDAILFLEEQLSLPLDFSYQVRIPSDASGPQTLAAELSYQYINMNNPAATLPSPLSLSDDSGEDDGGCSPEAILLTGPIASGSNQQWRSEHSIQASGNVAVAAGARLSLEAPRISLAPSFRVASGGRFSASVQAVDCSAAAAAATDRLGAPLAVTDDPDASATAAAAQTTHTDSSAPAVKAAPSTSSMLASKSAPATTITPAAPQLIQAASALPTWLQDRLSQLGIDADAIDSGLLDADKHWLILETRQALLTSDSNQGASDLYRLDLLTDQLQLISATEQGRAGNGPSRHPAADASGERIIFHSEADDLVPLDRNQVSDIFMRDLALGQTTTLTYAEQASANPALDAGGETLVYDQASDEGQRQVFGQAVASGSIAERLSLHTNTEGIRIDAHHPAISADGRFVAYLEHQVMSRDETACQVHLYDRDTEVYHRQLCPDALARASVSEEASMRGIFSEGAQSLDWYLPGVAEPVRLSNSLSLEATSARGQAR